MNCRESRRLFPVTERLAYLDSAADCPPPVPVAEAMLGFIEDNASWGCVNFGVWLERAERCRSRFAGLVNCLPDEVAFVKNTTQGLVIAAESIPLRQGDLIVINDMEFPANVHPWHMVARRRGARVKTIRSRAGRVTPGMIDKALNRQVKVLALSAVQYENGFFADLDTIGRICSERGVVFVVDGIQACGVVPVDVRRSRISILSTGSHKWLMGTGGCGFLFVDAELMPGLLPVNTGWLGHESPFEFSSEFKPAGGARRYEEGTLNMAAVFGLDAALGLIDSIGVGNIAAHVEKLADRLVLGLERKAYRVESPMSAGERSGIVLFRGGPLSASALHQTLAEAGVITSVRAGGIRVSMHCFNDEEDVDRLLDALP